MRVPTNEAAKRRPIAEEDLVDLSRRGIYQVAISPDASKAAVVTGWTDNLYADYSRNVMRRCLWLMERDVPGQRLLCDRDGHGPAWSTSGCAIAYLSRASGNAEIWRVSLDGADKLRLTHVGEAGDDHFQTTRLIWTPDDQSVVFTLGRSSGRHRDENVEAQYANPVQVEKALRSTEREVVGTQLWSIAASGGDPAFIAELSQTAGRPIGWGPGGDDLLLSCGRDICAVAANTGETRVVVSEDHCLATLDHSGQLWLVKQKDAALEVGPVAGGAWVSVYECPSDSYLDEPRALLPEAARLYFLRRLGTNRQLVEVDLNARQFSVITGPDDVAGADGSAYGLSSVPSSGPFWFPLSTPHRPAEVYVCGPNLGMQRVSELSPLAEQLELPEVRKLSWKSEGWDIEGLLVLPRGPVPSSGHPMLVYLHGGPNSEVQCAFESLASPRAQSAAYYMAANGFAVLMVNFRGSRGYGRDYMAQLGGYHIFDRPFADVMSGVDTLVAEGAADPNALGIYGHSYGAVLAVWAIAHTSRFRGALGACGIYDEEAHARYSQMPFVVQNEACWEGVDAAEIWRRPELWRLLSPMPHVHEIKTPVLLIETSAEHRAGQEARPLFNTIRVLGVEAYLAYYPNAFHSGGWNDGYKRDYLRRALVWFRHTLLGADLPEWFSEPLRECE